MPAVSHTTSHTTPARPSISPLSSPTRTLKSSPMTTRDTTVHDIEAQLNSEMGVEHDAQTDLGAGQDDGSSSLSEPDEDEEDEADEDEEAVEEGDAGVTEGNRAQRDMEVDSEAETERLDQTPQKLRKAVDALGKTPSKLSHAATAEEDLDLSDPPSPLPTGAGAASSTSTVATAGQKRKRSDTADSPLTSAESDIGESPRKRSHDDPIEQPAEREEEAQPSTEAAERIEGTPLAEEAPPAPVGRGRGRKGKQKFKKAETSTPQLMIETTEAEEEAVEDSPAKTEEEIQAKKEASAIYDTVAKEFRAFREKLYNERLAGLTAELNLLSQPECEHPEYLRQVACVDARLHKQVREAHAFYNYRLRSIRDRVLGDRALKHSQFYQEVRELREDVLYKLGEDWYAIQKERRMSAEEDEKKYLYLYNPKKSAQIRQQAKYNREVSILSGMAKYVGFPAAPELEGARAEDAEEDFRAMRIRPRTLFQPTTTTLPQPLTTTQQPRANYLPTPTPQSERQAHEQFLEQNPWARAQAPIHHSHAHASGVGTPGISHTPDWVEPTSSGRQLLRDLSGQIWRNAAGMAARSSPLGTPIPNRVASASGAPPASAGERVGMVGGNVASSPAMPPVPKNREIGAGNDHLTGYRNISNISAISGTSTIDAPLPPTGEDTPDRPRSRQLDKQGHLPGPAGLLQQASAPQQAFDTSQIHSLSRHPDSGGERREEVYASNGLGPRVGQFGTPAPPQRVAASPAVGSGGGGSV